MVFFFWLGVAAAAWKYGGCCLPWVVDWRIVWDENTIEFFFFFQKSDGSIDSDTKCFELRNKKIV